jgi:hypothetical protein
MFISIVGKWKIERFGPSGYMCREGKNVVVDNGVEALASLLNDAAATATTNTFRYLAVGTGNTAESSTDTDLGTETARHTGTVSYISGAIYQVKATYTTGIATGDIVEYGLFNSNANGTMFSRDTEATIAVGANDTLAVTAQYTFAGA